MKKFLIAILLVTYNFTYSQIPIGLKYDCNAYAFNGYFDPLTYSPEIKITKVHNSDSYEIGYYYDSSGYKISGLIKFQDDKIWFKQGEKEFRDKIKPEEIKNFVIGVDSFFTITNYYYQNSLKKKPVFVQYLTEFNDYTFVKHYHFRGLYLQGQDPIVVTFLVKSKDGNTWENFPDNNNFKEKALKYFSHIPYLKEKISSGKYKSKDMMSILKMAEYFSKYEHSQKVFFDEYWQETRDKSNAKYSAQIIDKRDSIWTLEYYKDSTKLFLANYSAFYPNNKNGDFISYYPDGTIRKIITYKNDEPVEIKSYASNGNLKNHYKYVKPKDNSTSELHTGIQYVEAIDSLGKNIIESNGIQKLDYFDEINNLLYSQLYMNKKLISSYRITKSDTIFQITDPEYDFKLKPLQKRFDFYMEDKKYLEALSCNAQGIVLLSLIIDRKGYVIGGKRLNEIHPEIDKLVDNFIRNTLMSTAEFPVKFKPYKTGKKKQICETVIPIEFSTNRFYRQPATFNNNMFMHHHWQMQQQVNFRPTVPAGFR